MRNMGCEDFSKAMGVKEEMNAEAEITDIQRFSVHDGTGIRTLVFFKGCPLRCIWCHNPETQRKQPQLFCIESKCIHCGACILACPKQAVSVKGEEIVTDRISCVECGECVKVCFSGARKIVGRKYTVEEVIEKVLQDEVFYKYSGGGVTLSGGDPVAHIEFACELLLRLKQLGIHTAIETCGVCCEEDFTRLLENVDLVLFDLKHTDTEMHKKYTGSGNELPLKNLEVIKKMQKPLIIRVPLIPNFNDNEKNLRNTAKYALKFGAYQVHLLPFHQLGESKWKSLDRHYLLAGKDEPSPDILKRARSIFEGYGLNVNVGGYGG